MNMKQINGVLPAADLALMVGLTDLYVVSAVCGWPHVGILRELSFSPPAFPLHAPSPCT